MRVIGIDPGLQCTGFGVVQVDGPRLQYVASGVINTRRFEEDGAKSSLASRLGVLFDGISQVVQRYQPTVAACEIVFVNTNPQATLLLGQARGCCLTALVAAGLPVSEYTALQLKKAVTGSGKADKSQVQEMVRHLLGLPGLPGPDAADALGLCIMHANLAAQVAAVGRAGVVCGKTGHKPPMRAGRLVADLGRPRSIRSSAGNMLPAPN